MPNSRLRENAQFPRRLLSQTVRWTAQSRGPLADLYVALLALLALLGCGLLLVDGHGRALEFAATLVIVCGAALASERVGQLMAVGGPAVYLSLEGFHGRLEGHRYWEHVVFVTAIAGSILASSHLGHRARRIERSAVAAQAEADALRAAEPSGVGARGLAPLQYELARARRNAHRLALLLVSPDHGSEAGGELLDELLAEVLRAVDVPLPAEGADRCIVLPETSAVDARSAAERIRLAFESRSGETVAIGIAAFPADGITNDELTVAAEEALAHARALGGNRSLLRSRTEDVPAGWAVSAGDAAER